MRLKYMHEWRADTWFFGFGFAGEYFPIDDVSINAQTTFLLPATGIANSLDIDGRYYFTQDKFQLYGLLGWGYYYRNFEFNEIGHLHKHAINVGAGFLYKFIDEIGLEAEYKFQAGQINTSIFRLGVVYFIN
ncbi:hypothetical protein A3SI_08631 [Nitritalea halalkaliphila LW7]|uniref:Uncharacterized protein n=2 Tax=Nitritalea TaxID=1187887 RepID=I5C4L7_9BACT|nr:hypothetical protein A3SI_08631 [Nitritalea halalkaliphila LW7]